MKKLILVCLISFLGISFLNAQVTITKCAAGFPVSVPGTGGLSQPLPNMTFTIADFAALTTPQLVDIEVSITWSHDGSCGGGSNIDHSLIGFTLTDPSSVTRDLATSTLNGAPSWSGTSGNTATVTTFTLTGASLLPLTTPVSGSFSPNGPAMNSYWAQNPVGNWAVGVYHDGNATDANVCIQNVCITITACDASIPMSAACNSLSVLPLGSNGTATLNFNNVDAGSNTGCMIQNVNFTQSLFNCSNTAVDVPVTMTITDRLGRSANCSSSIHVVDITAPVISCPGNQLETPNGSCQFTLPDYTGLATPTDNCAASITQSPMPGTVISSNTTLTMTATDGSGNSSQCTFDVILDFDDASFNYGASSYSGSDADPTPTITGVTGGAFSSSPTGLSINPSTGVININASTPNVYTVTYTTAGVCQRSSNVSVTIIPDLVISEIMYNGPEAGTDTTEFIEIYNNDVAAVDLTNYSFTQGVTYTFPSVTLNPGEFYVVAVNSAAFNNVFGFMPDGQYSGSLSNAGEDITIIDASGNMIDSVDYNDVAPWPSGVAAGEPDGGGSSIVLCDVNSDNNDGVNWNASVAGTGVIINSFEVKASPGVANFCCSMDVTPPTITCADTDTLYAGAGGCGVASRFVNEYYIPLSQFTSYDGTGGPGCNASLDIYSCGADMTFTWNSLETGMPSSVDIEFFQSFYSVGANTPVTFNGSANNDYVSADFNCSNNVINYSLIPTSYVVGGLNSLTLTPPSGCMVFDENPDLSWDPQSYAKITVVYGTGSILTMPVVTDNCTVDTVYNDAPSILPVGTTNVTWTAMDANGNSNTCMQQVVVIDTIAPMITCPTDITLAADNGTCGFDVSTSFENVYYISLADISSDGVNGPDCNGTGNDAYSCDSVELSISWNSLETINPSNVQVEFYQSYYDVGGISSTTFNSIPNNDYVSTDGMCSNQVVNYNLDPSGYAVGGSNTLTIIPTINCIVLDENPDPSWAPQSYAKVTVSYGIGAASAADNCAIDTIYNDAPSVLPVGTTTVTWTATDVNGNSSTCSQQVTIEDLEAPTAVCQNINAYIDGSGNATIVASDLDGGSTDNCSGITFGASLTTFTCSDLGPNNVTLTVTDGNGNIDTCVAVVTVMDTIAPTILCPSDIISCVGDVVNFTAPAGADNCSQTVAQTDATGLASGMVFPTGVTTIEYTSTDGSGNTAVCSFNVTVSTIDISITNTSPTLTANQTGATYRWLDCDNGNAVIPSEAGQSYTATVNGNYAVEITVGSCVDTSACENITGVGIKEAATNVVSIYPNPTNGMFTISLANTNQAVSYTITTLEGRIVEQANNVTANSIEVDLTNESKGVYFLIIQENNTNTTYKILKQ